MTNHSDQYGSVFCNPYTLNSSKLVDESHFSSACDNAIVICNQEHDPKIDINQKCVYEEMREYHWCRNGTDTIRESLVVASAEKAQVSSQV